MVPSIAGHDLFGGKTLGDQVSQGIATPPFLTGVKVVGATGRGVRLDGPEAGLGIPTGQVFRSLPRPVLAHAESNDVRGIESAR